uniref:Uncharacterized protein n=1 Tax=Rangifer tarandus platyrhynchus TaxID=3082113 RepID=A0ACB0E6I4_RANTA|nr:unnamed protein product [Rangifer tarandus platyrhynchus]
MTCDILKVLVQFKQAEVCGRLYPFSEAGPFSTSKIPNPSHFLPLSPYWSATEADSPVRLLSHLASRGPAHSDPLPYRRPGAAGPPLPHADLTRPPLLSRTPLLCARLTPLPVPTTTAHPDSSSLCPPPPSLPHSPFADFEASPLPPFPERPPGHYQPGPSAPTEPTPPSPPPQIPPPAPSHSPTAPGPHSPASLRSRSRTCRQRHLTAAQSKRNFSSVPPISGGRAPAAESGCVGRRF